MPNPSKRKLAQRENLERARSAIPGSVDNVLKQNEEVQKLLSEEKKRVVDLEKRIDVYKTELHRYETCLKNAEEKLSMEIRDHNCTKLALKTCQEKKVASEISYEAQISELQNRCNQLLLESPARGKVLKKYEDISSPHTKNRRCERIVEEMGKFVGEDSLDAFGKDFALFLSKSSRFSFRLSMTAEETFELVTRLNMTDGKLRSIKKFISGKLGFDPFASRKVVNELRKKCDPRLYYYVTTSTAVNTVCGRKFVIPITKAVCFDVRSLLKRRLESLSASSSLIFDSGTNGDIVLAVTADKGSDTTKICLAIENVPKPNNPKSLLLLGYYVGNDNYKEMKEHFQSIFSQLNDLNSIQYDESGALKIRIIRKKIVGDCKTISSLYNHPGQMSSDCCFICKITICKQGKNRDTIMDFEFDECGELRCLEDMIADGFEPLLSIEPSCCQPPPLHLFMGLTKSYVVDSLYATCNVIDFKHDVLPETLSEQKKLLKMLEVEHDHYKDVLSSLEQTQELISDVLIAARSLQKGTKSDMSSCDFDWCIVPLLKQKNQDQDLFECESCLKSIHTCCNALFGYEECDTSANQHISCCKCLQHGDLSMDDWNDIVVEKSEKVAQRIRSQLDLISSVEEEQQILENHLKCSFGETCKKFESVLVQIGCDPRAHYQQMNGNQTQALLKPVNIDKVLRVFEPHRDMSLMRRLMNVIGSLMSSSNNSVKSNQEILEMKENLDDLKNVLRLLHPTMSVLPKLHILSAHLIDFVVLNGTWGRTSEQGMESFHALFNQLTKQYASVHNLEHRTFLILRHLMHYNDMTDCSN